MKSGSHAPLPDDNCHKGPPEPLPCTKATIVLHKIMYASTSTKQLSVQPQTGATLLLAVVAKEHCFKMPNGILFTLPLKVPQIFDSTQCLSWPCSHCGALQFLSRCHYLKNLFHCDLGWWIWAKWGSFRIRGKASTHWVSGGRDIHCSVLWVGIMTGPHHCHKQRRNGTGSWPGSLTLVSAFLAMLLITVKPGEDN